MRRGPFHQSRCLLSWVAGAVLALAAAPAIAATAQEIDRNADAALATLYAQAPRAKELAASAKGILVFPSIVKAGLLVGGQFGEGVLRRNGKSVGYYNIAAASVGLQAGAQTFGYVMFLMTADALDYLDRSAGWEVGVGPSVVVLDQGAATSLTTTTAKSDVYAFIFSQNGLMAGAGLQGSKISKINPGQ